MAYMRLGDLLISAGVITEEELEKGLALQKESKERLGTVLIKNNIITENQLIEALQMQLGIEFVDLTKISIPTEMAQALPKNIATQYQIVPVRIVKDELFLAMADPMNFYAIEEAKRATRRRIHPLVATAAGIEHSIQVLYSNEGAAKAIEEMKREVAGSSDSSSSGNDYAFISTQLGDDSVNSAPTIRLVNSMLERAITERASDIHMEPRETELVIRMRIDGVMRRIMSGMDISEHRIPQDGRFNVRIKDKDIDLRVNSLPTAYGEKIVLRLLDKSGGRVTKEAVGLTGVAQEKYDEMLRLRNGVLLVVGPTGSGKSTTMYAMINQLNTEDVNMVTLEDPVEYNIDGINQVQINTKVGMTFANGLRAILRQDPDIIAVGEIRDGETADIALRSAITGHIVLSTIHTNDAVGTIDRLRDMGCEPYIIASALKGVISQRLVRRVCPNCKTAYKPTPEELQDMGLPEDADETWYRGNGCPNCFNRGYRGRAAVFEMLVIDRKVRNLIYSQAGRTAIEAELKNPENGFVSMQQNALRLVREGVTTAEEVRRVINEDD